MVRQGNQIDNGGYVSLAQMDVLGRRTFVKSALCMAAAGVVGGGQAVECSDDVMDQWQRETDLVAPDVYNAYMVDGNTRGLSSLEKLEKAFKDIVRAADETVVGDIPAIWSVYNMGYIVKTREALFSIDLVHRCAAEFAPKLDFALITHNHRDHWRDDFYKVLNGAGKTVISNFLDNYGATGLKRHHTDWKANGGYIRGVKTFKIKDVEIRTSLIDHNDYLIDFTTAFEIKIGNFILYHTGDSGKGTEPKLGTVWGCPDLWLFFPGCGINVAKAIERVKPKRVVFGHLWELGHKTGRLTTPMVRTAKAKAESVGFKNVATALWGDRVC